jgi:glycosyltransferase involved in cell wall biosynthesis
VNILIINRFFGSLERGAETWAKNLRENLDEEVVFANSVFPLGNISKANIVIPTNGRAQVFACRIVTFVLRKPMVVFGHSGPGADDKWNLLCAPNVFVAFSEAQKKWAEKYKLPFTKIKLIHHAVDIEKFKPARKKPKKKIVLCVAADTADKRVDLVKKAVAKLSGYKFVGVGKGNEKQVDFEKMPKVYKEADVFCFVPKSHEAFGLVFLEAMASNLPIVTINDETRREIVGNAGILVDNPNDTDKLAEVIKKAYETGWGNKPRKQALKFSWENAVNDYAALFKSLK